MTKVTRWYPDTCGCVIDLQWDSEAPSDQRVHTPVATTACSVHAPHAGKHDALHAAVLAENQHKNRSTAALAQARGVEAHTIGFSYDAARTLRLHVGNEVLEA